MRADSGIRQPIGTLANLVAEGLDLVIRLGGQVKCIGGRNAGQAKPNRGVEAFSPSVASWRSNMEIIASLP